MIILSFIIFIFALIMTSISGLYYLGHKLWGKKEDKWYDPIKSSIG